MVSGVPALMRALPGVTSSATRDGNKRQRRGIDACRAGSRPSKDEHDEHDDAPPAAWNPARRSSVARDHLVEDRPRRAPAPASASIDSASAGRRAAPLGLDESTALTRRSSSDGARSSMKRATVRRTGLWRERRQPQTMAATMQPERHNSHAAASAIGGLPARRPARAAMTSSDASTTDGGERGAHRGDAGPIASVQRDRTRRSRSRICS